MIDFDEAPVRRPYESVVPLINIVFLLLIFFLLAGTVKPSDPVKVELPAGEVDDKGGLQDFALYMEADGFVHFGEKLMDAQMAPYMLKDDIKQAGVEKVSINADKGAPAHELLKLMEGLRTIGVKQVLLVTNRGDDSATAEGATP